MVDEIATAAKNERCSVRAVTFVNTKQLTILYIFSLPSCIFYNTWLDPCPVCRMPIDLVIQHFWA